MKIAGVAGAITVVAVAAAATVVIANQNSPELKLSQDSSGTIRSRADLLRRFDRLERDLLALHQSR